MYFHTPAIRLCHIMARLDATPKKENIFQLAVVTLRGQEHLLRPGTLNAVPASLL
jgi:hypothetical protein